MYLFHDLLSKKKNFLLNWAVESQHLSNSLSLIVTLVYFDFFIIFNLINNLYLCPLGISVYVQTAGPSDFQNVSGLSFLPANFTIDEDNFSSITEHSLVVLDDFSFKLANNKQEKINFLKVVNYLILVIHNLFSNNLSNDILCAHHVFLTFTNLGYLIMRWYYILYFYKALHTFFFIFFFRKLFMRLGCPEVLDFFQSVQKANYHFANITS